MKANPLETSTLLSDPTEFVDPRFRRRGGNGLEGPIKDLSEPFNPSWIEGPTGLRIGDQYLVY